MRVLASRCKRIENFKCADKCFAIIIIIIIINIIINIINIIIIIIIIIIISTIRIILFRNARKFIIEGLIVII